MILGGAILLGIAIAWGAVAAWSMFRLGLRPAAAFLFAPLKLVFRIRTGPIRAARMADGPVIYAIIHQSRLDPALMLALLPPETLHILDERAARSTWMEPFRELARTIAFNAEHVFVSRRLVRHLRGKGRLAVYIPDMVEPDAKAFRLHRAVARIAATADARIVPIIIAGSHRITPTVRQRAARRGLPSLRVVALDAMTLAELAARSGVPQTAANALFDRLAEARVVAGLDPGSTVFSALRDAARDFGPDRIAVEDVVQPPLSYRRLFAAARFLGGRLASVSAPGEAVGVLLPNSVALAATLVGLFSAGRVAAMLNYTAGQAAVTAAVRTATIRTVISSRAFIAKAELGETVKAVETGGAKVVWIEDIRAEASAFDRLTALLLWQRPIASVKPADPAVILFTSGSEALPKAVVLSNRNVLANALQVASRLAFTPADSLLNPLPLFHSFGLTGGTILPLIVGVRLLLYPSPLHYRLIPETAAKMKPTILVGTDTFLNAYARAAKDSDFASLRLVVAGAEPVKAETRRIWKDRFGADIVEGFGLTEASPVVAVNTATHGRHSTVGRMMPGMRARLEAVEGVTEGGRLWISGPNVMQGYVDPASPSRLISPPDGWHDTGDIVAFDREGFVTIKGRAKRFAKIGGEMVSLGAIEMLVNALWPEDRHAVVSVPDRRKGERIVLVTTAEEADPAAIRAYGRSQGASGIAAPDDVIRVEEIPILGTGKTDYATTRKLALEKLGIDKAA